LLGIKISIAFWDSLLDRYLSPAREQLGAQAGVVWEDAPRGLAFVFNANRINVATSRAQCGVELVCSPRLLEADCRSIEEIRLVNALCRFVELAQS
jgi:hypothetical protein